jgi:hypothetical protein
MLSRVALRAPAPVKAAFIEQFNDEPNRETA